MVLIHVSGLKKMGKWCCYRDRKQSKEVCGENTEHSFRVDRF